MEEKMRNFKKKTSSRRKLATCVDSQGVKVVPIKTFHQQRRSTALPSKVGWLQLWLVGLPQKYIFPSYSAILQACHFTIKNLNYERPKIEGATDSIREEDKEGQN